MPSTSFQHNSMRLQHQPFSYDRRLQHDQQHRQRALWLSPRLRHCLRICAGVQDGNVVSEGVKRGDLLRAVAGARTAVMSILMECVPFNIMPPFGMMLRMQEHWSHHSYSSQGPGQQRRRLLNSSHSLQWARHAT